MKKTNKLMALLIALAMLASMMSFAATVSAENSVATVEVSEADVELSVKLQTLGLITNEFELSKYVTRGEMASIVTKYVAVPATGGQAFNDVTPAHPYFGAIGALYNMGVVTGDGNGNFNPDNYVTYDEALVYIINAIGHKPFAVREGGYPTGYHRIAIKHGMLADLSMKKGTDKATLADVYKMLDKGMTAATVVTSYYGDGDIRYSLSDTETFLSDVHKIKQYRGIITGIPGTRLTSLASDIKEDQIEINDKKYQLYGYPEFSMLGYSVDFYVNADDPDVILHIEETNRRNNAIRIDADDYIPLKGKTTNSRIYYTDDESKEYHIDLDTNFKMIYNNQFYDMWGVLSRVLPDNGYVEALDNNNDGVYDILFVFSYVNAYVEGISSDFTIIRDKISGTQINLAEYQQVVNVYYNGSRKLTADSIQLGDVLSIVESKNYPKIKSVYISRNVVSGKIESMDSVRGYYINGNWYELADPSYAANLKLGTVGTFYLDINNEIAYHSLDMSTRKGETGVMSAVDCKIKNLGSTIEVRIYTSKGEFLYAELNNVVKIDGERYDLSDVAKARLAADKLAPGATSGQKLNSAYVVNYVINDGKITELDLGGISEPGTLNKQRLGATSILLATSKVLSCSKESGGTFRMRMNPKDSVVFGVPDDGELDNLKGYKITSLVEQHNYGNDVNKLAYGEEDYASSIDIYSYAETEYPMVDVVLLRGAAAVSEYASRNNSLDIITDIGQTVTEDGELAYKLYMANGEYLMSSKVNLTELTVETPEVDAATVMTKLHKGMVIQYVVDTDDMISAIRLVADYVNGELKPLFKTASTYVELGDDSGNYDSYSGNNVVMGIIDGVDFDSNQAYFRTPVTSVEDPAEFLLYLSNEEVLIYDSATGEITKGSNADILPQDKFVAHLKLYYVPQTFIIFR